MSNADPERRQPLPDIPEVTVTPELAPVTDLVMTSDDIVNGLFVRDRAKRLHTEVYLDKHYIYEADLNEEGIFEDQYSARSTYIYAENQNRETACRYITGTGKEGGLLSLPTPFHFAVDTDVIRKISGEKNLRAIKPRKAIEVSGLVSAVKTGREGRKGELDATKLAYARILRDSLDKGHQIWFMNTHKELVRSLQMLVGKDQVGILGDAMDYMNSPTVPIAMNPQDVVRAVLEDESLLGNADYLRATLQGVNERYLSKELKAILKRHDIDMKPPTLIEKGSEFWHNHYRAIGYVGITAYTLARAAPVIGVGAAYDANPVGTYGFFLLDVATAVPYAKGMFDAIAGDTDRRRIVGGVTAIASFVAPYAWLGGVSGQELPVWFNGTVGGLATVLAANSINQYIKGKRLETNLVTAHPEA